jgi:hypothetical protein
MAQHGANSANTSIFRFFSAFKCISIVALGLQFPAQRRTFYLHYKWLVVNLTRSQLHGARLRGAHVLQRRNCKCKVFFLIYFRYPPLTLVLCAPCAEKQALLCVMAGANFL